MHDSAADGIKINLVIPYSFMGQCGHLSSYIGTYKNYYSKLNEFLSIFHQILFFKTAKLIFLWYTVGWEAKDK